VALHSFVKRFFTPGNWLVVEWTWEQPLDSIDHDEWPITNAVLSPIDANKQQRRFFLQLRSAHQGTGRGVARFHPGFGGLYRSLVGCPATRLEGRLLIGF